MEKLRDSGSLRRSCCRGWRGVLGLCSMGAWLTYLVLDAYGVKCRHCSARRTPGETSDRSERSWFQALMLSFKKMPSYNLGTTPGDGHKTHFLLGSLLCKSQCGHPAWLVQMRGQPRGTPSPALAPDFCVLLSQFLEWVCSGVTGKWHFIKTCCNCPRPAGGWATVISWPAFLDLVTVITEE